MSKYYCKHCDKTVERDSEKKTIKSWCTYTNKNVILTKKDD